MPAAILGTLTVLITYLLVISLFDHTAMSMPKLKEKVWLNGNVIGLVAALLLAISPWHVQLSRGAFEANLPSFFIPLGWWAFEAGLVKRRWMILSALSFGLGLFAYHSAKFVIPIAITLLFFAHRQFFQRFNLKIILSRYLFSLGIFSIFLLVALGTTFFGASTRAADVAIFSPTGGWQAAFDLRYDGALLGEPALLGKLFWNKLTYIGSLFIGNYLSYFSVQFLFTQGPGEATYGMAPGIGVLYLFELAFLVSAIFKITKLGLIKTYPFWILVALILITPIPAALTKGPGLAANRLAIMMPFIQILSAFGGISLFYKLSQVLGKNLNILAITVIVIASLTSFVDRYFYHSPIVVAPHMSYGWDKAAQYLGLVSPNYEKIIVSHEFSEPQIFIGFFLKEDPVFFQQQSKKWLQYEISGLKFVDQLGEYSLGKYEFRRINYPSDSRGDNILLVGKEEELPLDKNILKQINYPDGKPAIRISKSGLGVL